MKIASFILLFAIAAGTKPLPELLTSKLVLSYYISGQLIPVQNVTLYMDNKQRALLLHPVEPLPPHCDSFYVNEYFYDTTGYYDEQGVCRTLQGYNFDSPAANPLASLAFAKPNGTGIIAWYSDKKLPKYNFNTDSSNGTFWIDESGAESRVVALDTFVTSAGLPGSKPSTAHLVYNFETFDAGKLPANILVLPEQCTTSPPRCNPKQSAAESAVNKTFYLAHPLNATGQIGNQDAGDLLGDTNFVCLVSGLQVQTVW
jgi:hypothetical protein